MTLWKKLLGVTSIAALIYCSTPKQANAQRNFSGLVKGVSAANCPIQYTNPSNNTINSVAGIYLPKLKAWYHSVTSPSGWINVGNTCRIRASKDGKEQNVWKIVEGSTNRVVTMFLDRARNYSIVVKNIENGSDTLVHIWAQVKHNNRWSDAVHDTVNTTTTFDDGPLNIAKSDSVWKWTANGTNWNEILGDSVRYNAVGLIHGRTGTSRGVVRRSLNEADYLPDIVLQVGVEEKSLENKISEYDLNVQENPSKNPILYALGYAGKKKGLRIYGAMGDFIGEYLSDDGRWQIKGLKAGVYFAVLDHNRKKFVVVE